MFTNHKVYAENHTLEPQISSCYRYLEQQENLCNGIKSNKKNHTMVFRAIGKLMLLYLKQQGNQCSR